MKSHVRLLFGAVLLALPAAVLTQSQASSVHSRAIVIDTHADTTQRLIFDPRFNIAERHGDGNVDIPRMRDGGMDGLFFSIFMSR